MALRNVRVVVVAIVLSIALIGGGFVVGYSIYQRPRDEQISFLQNQNAELQSQISDLEGDLSSLLGQFQDAEASIAQLQNQFEEADALKAELQSQISTLQAIISSLKERADQNITTGLNGTIMIGSLLPLTGGLANLGQNSRVAINLAVEDVNNFLAEIGAAWTLKVIHENTGGAPYLCLTKLQSLAAKGIKFVVGPMSEAEVRNIMGYADSNRILVISHSSTALDLIIPDDYIFRFCPSDLFTGYVTARLMYDDGIRYVIAAWRGDAWADGLVEVTKNKFNELGGTFVESYLRYAPEASEFSAEAKDLANEVTNAVTTYGADKVGVLFIGSGEAATFLTAAREYDVLWTVKWYGSSGTALSEAMISNDAVAEFANETRFINPVFSPTESEKYDRVLEGVEAVLGSVPDAYAFVAYDAVWTLAHALLSVDRYSSEDVRAVLPEVTGSISGASGRIELNEAGDRKSANYDLWVIFEEWDIFVAGVNRYNWKHVGTYFGANDSITWL